MHMYYYHIICHVLLSQFIQLVVWQDFICHMVILLLSLKSFVISQSHFSSPCSSQVTQQVFLSGFTPASPAICHDLSPSRVICLVFVTHQASHFSFPSCQCSIPIQLVGLTFSLGNKLN